MSTPVMAGHDLEILVPWAPVAVFVLDTGIREPDVAIVVRQFMLARPPRNLLWLTVRPAVAILLAAIAFVKESLILALQLVVEDDAVYASAVFTDSLRGALIRPIDLDVVRQLARLPQASVKGLARLPGVFLLAPVRFEKVSAALGKNDRAVVGAEWRRAQQILLFEVPLGSPRALPAIVEIALRDYTKRSHGGQHPALGTVDLVHAISLSHRPTLTSARQVEVLREDVARVTIEIPIPFASCTSASEFANPLVGSVAKITWVVSVHSSLDRSTCSRFAPASDRSMGKAVGTGNRPSGVFGWSRVLCLVAAVRRGLGGAMTPEHYARDLVERCETLIESLLPVVMNDPSTRFGGPLGTTFLVAMSTPMILLRMERMLKPANCDSVADDRSIDEALGKAVTDTLSATARFGDAPFAQAGAWSYVAGHKPFNLAAGVPRELLERLSEHCGANAAMGALPSAC